MKQLKDNKLRTMTATTLSDKEFDNLFLEEVGEEGVVKADAYMRIHLETFNKIMDAVKMYKKITSVRSHLMDEDAHIKTKGFDKLIISSENDDGEEKEMKMLDIRINGLANRDYKSITLRQVLGNSCICDETKLVIIDGCIYGEEYDPIIFKKSHMELFKFPFEEEEKLTLFQLQEVFDEFHKTLICDTTCYNMIMDNVDKELDDWNYDFGSYQDKNWV